MIELIVKNYLSSALSVPVVLEVPTSKNAEEFVLIEKTGSSKTNQVNSATLAIQSWSDTLYGAASLNEEVKAAIEKITETTDISKAELNTDYNFSDSMTKSYRYQAVYDLVF